MTAALEGRVALVTGGGSGIGLATARLLASEGASVVVVDLDDRAGGEAAKAVGGAFFHADVSAVEEIVAAVAFAAETFGGLDVAHLNAGIDSHSADATSVTVEQYRRIVSVNVDHVVFGTKAAAEAMIGRGGGAIVVTASLAGLVPFPTDPLYTLTKHAVVGWVRAAAPELRVKGVRINCICPGFADTPLLTPDARRRFEEASFPLLKPEDIARAALAAATDPETGQAFVVQPGRPVETYRFRGVPGPRAEGAEGMPPPRLGERAR